MPDQELQSVTHQQACCTLSLFTDRRTSSYMQSTGHRMQLPSAYCLTSLTCFLQILRDEPVDCAVERHCCWHRLHTVRACALQTTASGSPSRSRTYCSWWIYYATPSLCAARAAAHPAPCRGLSCMAVVVQHIRLYVCCSAPTVRGFDGSCGICILNPAMRIQGCSIEWQQGSSRFVHLTSELLAASAQSCAAF